jgi:acetyl-CoA C-acetyltransferase
MAGFDREWEACFGVTPPPVFAMMAKEHMKKYGTTEEQLALVSVKNHNHSAKNPNAHFTHEITIDDVFNSKPIASPIKLYDCSSITDGAAAVVVACEDIVREFTKDPVFILGSIQGFSNYNISNEKELSSWPILKDCAQKLYDEVGIKPSDIDVAEVHDCFTPSEIIVYEELGFCEKGEGGKYIEAGLSDYGGEVVVNPRGGLIGCGHPFGATGVAQAVEIFLQLSGQAEGRQVPNARIGLTQTLSNIGGEQHLILSGKDM